MPQETEEGKTMMGGVIKKKWLFTQGGKSHGFMYSTYSDGKRTFSKGRKY